MGSCAPLGYAIQFYPYTGKGENYDSNLGLGGSVVATLAEKLPSQVGSNYHIIMDKAQNDRAETDQPVIDYVISNFITDFRQLSCRRGDICCCWYKIFVNKGMGGVDRLDQNISLYMISHRSKKWW